MGFDLGPQVHCHLLLQSGQPVCKGRPEVRKSGIHFVLELVQVSLHVGYSSRCVGLTSLEFGNASVKARQLALIKGLGLRSVFNSTEDGSNRSGVQASLCPWVLCWRGSVDWAGGEV